MESESASKPRLRVSGQQTKQLQTGNIQGLMIFVECYRDGEVMREKEHIVNDMQCDGGMFVDGEMANVG